MESLGLSATVTAMAARDFAQRFIGAGATKGRPDIVAGDNFIPFDELFRQQPHLQAQMPLVNNSLALSARSSF